MKKVLITGAKGFIGERVVKGLEECAYEVHCIARSHEYNSNTTYDNNSKMVKWYNIDLLKVGKIEKLIKDIKPHIIIHLAWHIVPEAQLLVDDRNLRWIDVGIRILEAFKEVGGECFIHGGTAMQYTLDAHYAKEEETPPLNDNLYSVCKNSFENISKAYCKINNIRFIGVRIFNVYGENRHKNKFLPSTIIKLLNNEEVVCNNGEQILDLIYVEDVAKAIIQLILVEAEGIINIGTGKPVKLGDVILQIGEMLGNKELITFIPKEKQHTKILVANNQKLIRLTGWKPEYTLHKGLEKMISYYKEEV